MQDVRFTKVEGAGNDFVCVDGFDGHFPRDPSALARAVCDRRFGVGGDGLLLLGRSDEGAARMEVWNADGSRSDMCGNALRCSALILARVHGVEGPCDLATDSGTARVEVVERDGDSAVVATTTGHPRFSAEEIPCTLGGDQVLDRPVMVGGVTVTLSAVRVGNPVAVLWVPSIDEAPVDRLGPLIEGAGQVFPDRINVAFAEVVDRGRIRQRTWERGCGETLACGTAASAVCVIGHVSGRTDSAVGIQLPGGTLDCSWTDEAGPVHVTGPARICFDGDWTCR